MHLFLTPSPLVVSSRQVRDALLDEKSLQDVSTMTEYADMSVVGIGAAVEGATVLRNGILNEGELTVLKDAGSRRRRPESLYDKTASYSDRN